MRIPENLCMLLSKALKMRAIKHTMALITDSSGRTKCAPAQMPWHLRHLNPALLNRQGMSTHPKMENGSELCHWKGQLVIGLRASPVRPRKPLQIGAKLGTLRGSTTCEAHLSSALPCRNGPQPRDPLLTNKKSISTDDIFDLVQIFKAQLKAQPDGPHAIADLLSWNRLLVLNTKPLINL